MWPLVSTKEKAFVLWRDGDREPSPLGDPFPSDRTSRHLTLQSHTETLASAMVFCHLTFLDLFLDTAVLLC